jgi:hypothetical protein
MKPISIVTALIVVTSCAPYPGSSNFSSNEHDEITDIADSSAFAMM